MGALTTADGATRGRVLFFDAYPHVVGGAQRATVLLAAELRARGWSVTVATPGPGPYVDLLAREGIRHLPVELPPSLMRYARQTQGAKAARAIASLPASWWSTSRALRRTFDIVHALDHRGQLLIGPSARLAGLPVVWHVHSVNPSASVNWFCARTASAIVVPSRSIAGVLPHVEPARTAEVPNALPPEVLRWPAVAPAPGPARIVSVGRIHPDKGYDVLMEAVAQLVRLDARTRCRVAARPQAGFEAYRDSLLATRSQLGLDANFELVTDVDDVHGFLQEGNVYVQASREGTELQPLAVMEAMAAGLPVVATSVGAVAEMLGGGERGTLVPPGDPMALAEAVSAAVSDRSEACSRAGRARAFVQETCTAERMAAQVESVYRSL